MFYSYGVAIFVAFGIILTILMLPKAFDFPNLLSQISFGGCVLFLKCFVYFQAQSSGKFLVFNTATRAFATVLFFSVKIRFFEIEKKRKKEKLKGYYCHSSSICNVKE